MDAFDRIMELSRQGLYCAQIMVQLASTPKAKRIRSWCRPCAALRRLRLVGRALRRAERRGLLPEPARPRAARRREIELIGQFHAWFRERTAQYGGEDCDCILEGDRRNMFKTCPGIVMDSYAKCAELLSERGLA